MFKQNGSGKSDIDKRNENGKDIGVIHDSQETLHQKSLPQRSRCGRYRCILRLQFVAPSEAIKYCPTVKSEEDNFQNHSEYSNILQIVAITSK